MTLDEAIKHCEEVAKQQEVKANELYKAKDFEESRDCIWCSKEHEQLAEWLKELKKFREQQPYEKFESTKDHIYKLAGDYKCWDNRLTEDEAVKLCHILEQEPCEDAISRADVKKYLSAPDANGERVIYESDLDLLSPVQPKIKTGHWIPVSEKLPEDIKPVIITWKNTDPKSYYQYIVGKHFIGTAHYKNGKWFWYSSVTEDLLAEYGRCDSEEFDEAIEVIAWMPLPEPFEPQESEGKE